MSYETPPEGWLDFGAHAALDEVPKLSFSERLGDDLLPLWERHDNCKCEFLKGGE